MVLLVMNTKESEEQTDQRVLSRLFVIAGVVRNKEVSVVRVEEEEETDDLKMIGMMFLTMLMVLPVL